MNPKTGHTFSSFLPWFRIVLCTACFITFAGSKNINPTTPMQDALNTLDKHIREKRPEFYKALRPPLTDQEIGDLEKKYKLRLPPEVKLLYKWKNGNDDYETFVNNSEFMRLESALESHALLTGMIGYDFEVKNWWNENWIPIFENGGGDHICVDVAGIFTGNAGQIVVFWHDSPTRIVEAPSLEAFISALNKYYETTKPEDFDEFFTITSVDGYPKSFEVK